MQLPIIELGPNEIDALKMIDGGSESIITTSNRQGTLYKIFDYDTGNDYDDGYGYGNRSNDKSTIISKEDDPWDLEELYHNKEAKLQAIYNMPYLQYSVLPLSIIKSDGKFVGYEMTYDRKDISLSSAVLSASGKIKALQRIKFILEYYTGRGIVYGDVRSDNILINRLTSGIKFCDIDNIGLGKLEIDVLPDIANRFISERGHVDQSLSMYMYNLLALEQIAYPGEEYETILSYLKNGKLPANFKDETKRVIEDMLEPKRFQGESILQYVKKVR